MARLATIDGRLQPNVVPICFALAGDTLYSAVDEKPKRSRKLKRLENIRTSPQVSVLVDHFESDWTKLWWVVAEGQAEVIEAGDEASEALELLVAKYPQYAIARPRGPIIALRIERWRSWSAEPQGWSPGA